MSTTIDFRYLSEADMIQAGVTNMADCIATMEEMFLLLHSGDYRMAGPNSDSHGAMVTFPENSPFPTMPKPTADRRFMAMPGYLGGDFHVAGMKWYGSNVANRDKGLPRSILMFVLNDADTGAPLAFMSANLLSAYRTGAIPGVGARHLAKADARVVGIQGPGVMARTSLSAFMAVRPTIDTLNIKGRSAQGVQNFVDWVKASFPSIVTINVVDSTEEVVRGADIVTFCTSTPTGNPDEYPPLKREWLSPGAFAAMPAACCMDDGLNAPEVRKVLDNIRLYEAWYEEVPKPAHCHIPLVGVQLMDSCAEGRVERASLEDLGAIVAGDSSGRRNDEEIIVMSVGGMPVEDIAWATKLYRNAVANDIGTTLNLWDQPALG
ncbi:tyramine oxidase subunit B [Carnimonas bestiolae]|uniref:tyramine oxidase subunit B n=1 Tax=Carnimonas bestiolae TaxID=3402172 RepID=UPI003EDB8A53